MLETRTCSNMAHSCSWKGLFLLLYFLKTFLRNASFLPLHLCGRPQSIQGFFFFFGVRNCFSMRYYWRKTKPEYKENLAVFQEPCSCTEHNALCSVVWGTRCWTAHTHSSAYEWEVLSECWQPRGQIYPSEHILNCSPVLGNWELVLTAVGKSSICWITWIPAQP